MSDDLVKRYREMQEAVGGCFDGHCVIKKPSGMHTNGGCTCLMHLKLHEASRVGQLLKYSQQMADRIEELEAKLAKALEALGNVVGEYDLFRKDEYERGLSPLDDEIHDARTTLAELKGKTDE